MSKTHACQQGGAFTQSSAGLPELDSHPPAGSTTSSPAVLALTLPFADWRFNEGAGTVAVDSAPVPHNGTVSGSGATWVLGIGSTALRLNGANNYVWYGTGPSLNGTTDFSLAALIKTSATTAGNIIQQRDSAGFNGEYILQLTSNGNPLLTVYGNSQYQFNNIWATNVLNDGQWHLIAVTRSNTVGRIYVDGALSLMASGPVVPLVSTIGVAVGRDVRNNTSWVVTNPRAYGFYAKVNPTVDHPRWSQAREKRLESKKLRSAVKELRRRP